MITILTAFKPFVGEALVHQTNALASWKALASEVEILVFGEPSMLEPFVDQFGARVVPSIPTSVDGRARVDAIFQYGCLHGQYDHQVYVNGDIILMRDFVSALQSIHLPKFLMIGQRTDVDVTELLSFDSEAEYRGLRDRLNFSGQLHDVWGLDYFAYVRGSIPALPPFYLGAAAWDNLMIYHCRRVGVPVIDATRDVRAFHQNHAYYSMRECPSAQANRALVTESACFLYATDATHWLDHGRLRSAFSSPQHAFRLISNYPVVRAWPRPLRRPFGIAARLIRRLGYA